MSEDLEPVSRALGHRFGDPSLLEAALTHRSAGSRNNERLEFLGDAILGLVIAEALFERYPRAREGELSRLRASLVKGETLARVARGLGLGAHLRLGAGELKSGGHRRASILADALEGAIGALYLDAGYDVARERVRALFGELLDELPEGDIPKDPKTRLQEHLQGRRLSLPDYAVVEISGEAHDQMFRVECRIEPLGRVTEGRGSSRRRAEQAAAREMLQALEAE